MNQKENFFFRKMFIVTEYAALSTNKLHNVVYFRLTSHDLPSVD